MCTISGIVSAEPAAHAVMGRLQLPGNNCISVSLPRATIAQLREQGPRPMTISGRVFGEPPPEVDAIITIKGRTIGLGLCSDFFVFVD